MIEFDYQFVDLGIGQVFATVMDMADRPVAVSVGVLDNERTEGGIGMADLAAVHEFGTADGHVPERSYLRSTMELNRDKYRAQLGELLKHVIRDEIMIDTAMRLMGETMESDVRRRILSDIPPELALSTLLRKRRLGQPDTALVATGALFDAIRHKVVRG